MRTTGKISGYVIAVCITLTISLVFGVLAYFHCHMEVDEGAQPMLFLSLSLLSAIAGLLIALESYLRLYKTFFRHFSDVETFAEALGKGDLPPRLSPVLNCAPELATVAQSMNFLRDRLCNTLGKLKNSYEREKAANAAAEKASALNFQFINRLSPELRTPLNSILGFDAVIRSDIAKGCYDRKLEKLTLAIEQNAEALQRQLNRLLDVSSLTVQHNKQQITEFVTEDFLRNLIDANNFALPSDDIQLVGSYPPDMPPMLCTDHDKLWAILGTLIRIQASASGPGEVLSCGCRKREDNVEFYVRDNRRSNCREQLAVLYNLHGKIRRPDGEVTMPADSIGFCFFFLAERTADLGGRLEAETNDFSRSEFKLIFPAWEVIPDNVANTSPLRMTNNLRHQGEKNTPRYAIPPSIEGGSHRRLRILIADNDRDNLRILKSLLEAEGHDIDMVTDGVDLLPVVREGNFDLALIALSLPQINVLEAIGKLEMGEESGQLPVIAMTGALNNEILSGLMRYGVHRCLVKPLHFEQIGRIVLQNAKPEKE